MSGPQTPPAHVPDEPRTGRNRVSVGQFHRVEEQPEAGEAASLTPLLRRIPVPSANVIVGLESTLGLIDEHLTRAQGLVLLAREDDGGGHGVSTAALAYARLYGHKYRSLIWLNGRVSAVLRSEYADLAYAMRLKASESGRQFQMIKGVQSALANGGPCLLIVDQPCDDSYTELLRDSPASHCIVTHARRVPEGFTSVQLPLFAAEDFAALFRAQGIQLSANSAHQLRSALEGNVLAAKLAAAYAASAKVEPETLLAQLRRTSETAPLRNDVSAAVQICLRAVMPWAAHAAPIAMELLGLCAHFGPEPIPLHLFRDGSSCVSRRLAQAIHDQQRWHAILGWLAHHGFAAIDNERVAVHESISAVMRQALSPDHARYLSIAALRITSKAFPIEETYDHPLPLCTRLLPHLLQALRYSERLSPPLEETGRMYNQVGQYLRTCEELESARTCYKHAVALARLTRGANHPALALRLNNLAVINQELGDADAARDCFEEAFTVSKARYGRTHAILLGQARNLGNFLEDTQDWAAARLLYEDIIERYSEQYGWNDAVTVEFVHRFGRVCQSQGEHERAHAAFEQALKAARMTESTALRGLMPILLIDYAAALVEQEDHDEAESLLAEAVDALERVKSRNDAVVMRAFARLGDVYRARKDWEHAQRWYEQAFHVGSAKACCSRAERATLATRAGRAANNCANYGIARRWLEKALAITIEQHGADSAAAASSLTTLGRTHEDSGAFAEALKCFKQAQGLFERHNGPRHESVAVAHRRMGRAYEGMQKLEEALRHYQQALAIHTAACGREHLATARDAENVAMVMIRLRNTTAALGYLHQALAVFEAQLGPSHRRSESVRSLIEDLHHQGG